MSRGLGNIQRQILSALDESPMVTLRGRNRSQTSANVRAARTLEKAGRCVLVALWNDDHTAASLVAFRAGYVLKDGRQVKDVSVASGPYGPRATLKGSQRDIAAHTGVSKTQVRRDLKKI